MLENEDEKIETEKKVIERGRPIEKKMVSNSCYSFRSPTINNKPLIHSHSPVPSFTSCSLNSISFSSSKTKLVVLTKKHSYSGILFFFSNFSNPFISEETFYFFQFLTSSCLLASCLRIRRYSSNPSFSVFSFKVIKLFNSFCLLSLFMFVNFLLGISERRAKYTSKEASRRRRRS